MHQSHPPGFTRFATLLITIVLALPSCAGLRPGYETPTVSLESFRALPAADALPEFEIGLGVINPNREPLEIVGISYTISVAGHELVKGVGKGFEVIEGYDKGRISLRAGANLLAGMRLVADLMIRSPDKLGYEFRAKLDMGAMRRAIRIREAGEFSIGAAPDTP